ncbi:unnamed protein product [Urochloa humidicola]
MAADGGDEQSVNIPGDVNGATVAGDDFYKVLDEMLAPYQVQQVQEVHQVVDAEAPGADEVAEVSEAPGADEAAEVPLEPPGAEKVAEAAPEAPGAKEAPKAAPEGHPWYMEGDTRSIFDDLEMPLGSTPHSHY